MFESDTPISPMCQIKCYIDVETRETCKMCLNCSYTDAFLCHHDKGAVVPQLKCENIIIFQQTISRSIESMIKYSHSFDGTF